MDRHITLAGALNLAIGILGILVVIAGSVMLGMIGYYITDPHAARIAMFAGSVGLTFLAIVAMAQIVGAAGLLKRRSWSRVMMMVVSAFNLIRFPLGTALGIYTIWVLIQDETKSILDAGQSPQPI